MIFAIKHEATGVIKELISILGTAIRSALAPDALLGHFSGWG
jgi:hypothetical protein